MKKTCLTLLSICFLVLQGCAQQPGTNAAQAANEWPSYGRDLSNQRFSPLAQINRDNVMQLAPAWT